MAATAVLLTGCSSTPSASTASAERPQIAVLVPMDKNNQYGRNYVSSLYQAADELGVDVFVMNSNYDATVQSAQMKIAIAKRVDGIVLWPALHGAELPMLLEAERAGIPVNVSNSEAPPEADAHYHVFTGPNDVRVGRIQGEQLARVLGGKGNYVYVSGTPGNAAAINRQNGLFDALKAYPGITLLGSQPGNFDQNIGQGAASALLSRFGDRIDAVVTPDDVSATGAAQALQAAGLTGKVKLIASGYYDTAPPMLRSGALSVTLFQSTCWDSGHALAAMLDVLADRPLPKKTYMPLPVVDRESMDQYSPFGCLPGSRTSGFGDATTE
ncbi:sugar ABC transporter substrate-binding protein [Rhodococcus sp. NPDC127528]|uniref:sugar ABC transporter substrate-binding protein n=1 Tax=unclassified Rhodococcus (in: high G+C Gram-positive bacteria) TaxID=192944 RepID=UPI003638F073